ncbi:MAG TPA: nucleotidyltransferase domain-containing protein [Candidatus Cloacimonadota bacterium]|nr:nucleotidyltransferase domain-containing protein [Candidatus Cloacimonadota bacterium]
MSKNQLLYGIKAETWKKITGVLRSKPAVEKIILFGSRAKGNFRNGSDIDLCVKGSALTEKDLNSLIRELDELDLPWEIDLLRYETISEPAVVDHIDRVGICLYPG